jgi:hypothetical protein
MECVIMKTLRAWLTDLRANSDMLVQEALVGGVDFYLSFLVFILLFISFSPAHMNMAA